MVELGDEYGVDHLAPGGIPVYETGFHAGNYVSHGAVSVQDLSCPQAVRGDFRLNGIVRVQHEGHLFSAKLDSPQLVQIVANPVAGRLNIEAHLVRVHVQDVKAHLQVDMINLAI